MDLQFENEISLPGNRIELGLDGRLDGHTAPSLDERLQAILPRATGGLVLNLARLEYLSSAGIRSLFTAQRQLIAANARLWVLAPQPAVLKVLDTVRILAPGAVVADRSELPEPG